MTEPHQPEVAVVTVPLRFRRRGGRKQVVTPEGTRPWAPQRERVDNALVKALARAHRWQQLLETGTYACVKDLAAAERIAPSYLSRVLRLTLLAPDIVEAILDGEGPEIRLEAVLRPFPEEWQGQQFSILAKG